MSSTLQEMSFPPEFAFHHADASSRSSTKVRLAMHVVLGADGSQALDDQILGPAKELDFAEDNTGALYMLLCIAHQKFNILPQAECGAAGFPVSMIVERAILCDRYLCADVLKTWIEIWARNQWPRYNFHDDGKYNSFTFEADAPKEIQGMMSSGLVFRDQGLVDFFKHGAKKLYDNLKTNYLPELPEQWHHLWSILEEVLATRAEVINAAVSRINDKFLANLKENSQDPCTKHNQMCKFLITSSLSTSDADIDIEEWNYYQMKEHQEADILVLSDYSIRRLRDRVWEKLWKKIELVTRIPPRDGFQDVCGKQVWAAGDVGCIERKKLMFHPTENIAGIK
ncbi:uncharacterized protein PAC_12998 [Phialocephala subalpina]|uniref:Uncharacterized protein n=1 Tax=Phialocephala subalpina TaxID=576137 RepID=A0A1L7XDK2_9HELO|nr:uncharacterized protein PAC_12998 [Phialocephala subalpina]